MKYTLAATYSADIRALPPSFRRSVKAANRAKQTISIYARAVLTR
jgi:hypothetical protein